LGEFRGKLKFRTPIISSVGKVQLSVGKLQLPAPCLFPQVFNPRW